jgi:hypothetical protein
VHCFGIIECHDFDPAHSTSHQRPWFYFRMPLSMAALRRSWTHVKTLPEGLEANLVSKSERRTRLQRRNEVALSRQASARSGVTAMCSIRC